MSSPPIHVTVVTGFLGSGKSTLLRRWLQELPRQDTAVIVNERGEVGIDGELLAAHVADLREITGGCVCCSSQAELLSALKELSSGSAPPRRIFVETSGAASPAGVVRGITAPGLRERLRLDGVVTVVDASRVSSHLQYDLTVEQLGFADVVVLSHVDQLERAAVPAVQSELERYAAAAVFTESHHGVPAIDFAELLARRTEVLHLPKGSTGHIAVEAVSLVMEGDLEEERFTDWVEQELARVEVNILRIKGILAMRGVEQRVIVQGVGQAVEVELGRPWEQTERSSRLVVLGLGLAGADLEAGFRRCAADALS